MASDALSLSMIVPVYNNPGDLRECLSTLAGQFTPDMEIIVVDDASTDDTASVASGLGARVIRLEKNSGPAAARNAGARQARGDILFFVDADVIVAPRTVERILKIFAARPDVAAVFGSYDAEPRAPGVVSRYRNLLHHYVHQHGQADASTFWAGCGAIRRDTFRAVGGFDDERFPRPSIEDIELGQRLRRAGHRILLDKTIQGTHLKRWSLGSLIRTDITRRALPWSRLILESKAVPDTLNLVWRERVSAALVAAAIATLPFAVVWPRLFVLPVAALAVLLVWNRELYLFFFQRGGMWFALACIPLHLLYYVYSGLSYLYVWLVHRFGSQSSARPGHA
ncbi:MAG TPA: glycosyltransferase family 2 protein [Methylomirabilota bacterium]|jgi:GT2 family glycosyltransferase